MQDIKTYIDNRIASLEHLVLHFREKGDMNFANQTWARLEELKTLKKSFSDKDGNWRDTI